MAYLLMIVEPVGQREARSDAEGREAYAVMLDYAEKLRQRGVLRGVESLQSQRHATRVSVAGGTRRLIDGPFAEAKEMVGGFLLIDGVSRDEAIAIAAACPAAQWCTIEVRETGPCYT
jgi:hypothetical protein